MSSDEPKQPRISPAAFAVAAIVLAAGGMSYAAYDDRTKGREAIEARAAESGEGASVPASAALTEGDDLDETGPEQASGGPEKAQSADPADPGKSEPQGGAGGDASAPDSPTLAQRPAASRRAAPGGTSASSISAATGSESGPATPSAAPAPVDGSPSGPANLPSGLAQQPPPPPAGAAYDSKDPEAPPAAGAGSSARDPQEPPSAGAGSTARDPEAPSAAGAP